MHFAGFVPNSFVDYKDNISFVAFVNNCNFDCWYCHNRWILTSKTIYTEDVILQKIASNKLIDAVVISGGEPTTQDTEEMISFIKKIKDLNLKVKLDTNGTNPLALEQLLPYIDFVAMDIKAPLSKYKEVTCITDLQILNIKKSIKLLKTFNNCEFRTTFLPNLSYDDILEISYTLGKECDYYLQKYNPTEKDAHIIPHTEAFIKDVAKKIGCKTRNCN